MKVLLSLFSNPPSQLSAPGSWSSMVGSADGIQKLGLIPCAISWLYSAIERRREKTWTDLTVSVSAVELCCGEEDTLRDLLGEVAPSFGSSIQDSPKAHIKIQEDPVYGIQVGGKSVWGSCRVCKTFCLTSSSQTIAILEGCYAQVLQSFAVVGSTNAGHCV